MGMRVLPVGQDQEGYGGLLREVGTSLPGVFLVVLVIWHPRTSPMGSCTGILVVAAEAYQGYTALATSVLAVIGDKTELSLTAR